MAYSTSVGGVCCVPSALRSRNKTMESFRNAVVVMMTNGMSATAAVATMSGSRAVSPILADPGDLHADCPGHLDQTAAADPPAVGDDVHRLVRVALQLEDVAAAEGLQLAQRQLHPADLEHHPYRQVGDPRVVRRPRPVARLIVRSVARCIGCIVPLPNLPSPRRGAGTAPRAAGPCAPPARRAKPAAPPPLRGAPHPEARRRARRRLRPASATARP